MQALVNKLKYVLIGKFSHGRPPMDTIKKFFVSLNLKGTCNTANFDKKHIYIECVCKEDYYRIWLKLNWFIDGYALRVFKWSPDFSPLKESSIALVWIRVEGLPLYLFDERSLLSILTSIGSPIRSDPWNLIRTMLHTARICVELDVCKPLLDAVLICFKEEGSENILGQFWAKVFYDEVPLFCASCCHIGHGTGTCKRGGVTSIQEQAVNILVVKMVDKMPHPQDFTNTVEHCGNVMGRQVKAWQIVGDQVNAWSVLGNRVVPENKALGLQHKVQGLQISEQVPTTDEQCRNAAPMKEVTAAGTSEEQTTTKVAEIRSSEAVQGTKTMVMQLFPQLVAAGVEQISGKITQLRKSTDDQYSTKLSVAITNTGKLAEVTEQRSVVTPDLGSESDMGSDVSGSSAVGLEKIEVAGFMSQPGTSAPLLQIAAEENRSMSVSTLQFRSRKDSVQGNAGTSYFSTGVAGPGPEVELAKLEASAKGKAVSTSAYSSVQPLIQDTDTKAMLWVNRYSPTTDFSIKPEKKGIDNKAKIWVIGNSPATDFRNKPERKGKYTQAWTGNKVTCSSKSWQLQHFQTSSPAGNNTIAAVAEHRA